MVRLRSHLMPYAGAADGVRRLAGNGADTAFGQGRRAAARFSGPTESGVCPPPAPTALQNASAASSTLT